MAPSPANDVALSLTGLLALAATLPAQPGRTVVPARYATAEARGTAFWALSPFKSRIQLLIADSELQNAKGRILTSLAVRRNMGTPDALTGGRLNVKLWLSHTRASIATPSSKFADNRGSDHSLVFAGNVDLRPVGPAPGKPAPWAAPWSVTIPLRKPFAYNGGTLCIESSTTPLGGRGRGAHPPWWTIDAVVDRSGGQVARFGSSCIRGAPAQPAGAQASSLRLGSTGLFHLRGAARPAAGLIMFGGSKDHAGSLRLPFDLRVFGAPSCHLRADVGFSDTVSVVPPPRARFGQSVYRADIPNTPALANATIYTQWAVLDRGANALGMTFSNGVAATIAPARPQWRYAWIEGPNSISVRGDVVSGRMPVLQLTHVAR